jgi:demethylmenaquinone methyltransferase / 2-methoxy-6-polyprenyl-1,4-benzoquinol methylase
VDRPGGAVSGEPASLGLDKEPQRIAGMFDAIAARYDLLNHLLSGGLDVHWRRQAIRALALRGGETVIDLCTGTADVALTAVGARPGAARVLGLDFAGRMLALGARKVARAHAGGRVLLARADVTMIPAASGSADAATVAFGIRNVAEPGRAYREVHRALRAGGRFAILEFSLPRVPVLRGFYLWYFRHVLPRVGRLISGHDSAYTYLPASVGTFPEPAHVVSQLAEAGFEDVRAVPLTFGVVYLYSARKPHSPA